MAYGDKMILETRYHGATDNTIDFESLLRNGKFELWSNTAAIADGWSHNLTQSPTFSRQAGSYTGGTGAYFQRITWAGPTQVTLGTINQTVELTGDNSYPSRGHRSRRFDVRVWARETGAGTASLLVSVYGYDKDNVFVATVASTNATLTGSWVEFLANGTINNDSIVKLVVDLQITSTVAGALTVEIDQAELWRTYTFANNPSLPDDPRIFIPTRRFMRGIAGQLIRTRSSSAIAKIEKTLSFGLIGKTQCDEFRSLFFLDSPMRWTPNHPLLPTYVDVRWVNDFNFRSLKNSFSDPKFGGVIQLSEL